MNILKTIKDFSQKLLKQVEEIHFPNLEHYLSSRYTFSVGKMVCEYCNFIAKNQQALSAHHRGCNVRKNMVLEKNEGEIIEQKKGESNVVIKTPITEKTKETKPKKTKLNISTN